METPKNRQVSYDASNKSAKDVALALSYRTQAQVAVADALCAQTVDVHFEAAQPARAIAEFARKVDAEFDHFFIFRPFGSDWAARPPTEGRERSGSVAGENQSGKRTTSRTGAIPPAGVSSGGFPPPRWEDMTPEEREKRRAEMEKEMEARLESMTPEQRKQAEQMRSQFEQFRKQTANMTPAQQMRTAVQMISANPQIQERVYQRSMEGLRNTTPEQRIELYRRLAEAQKRFEEMQQQRP